MVMRAGVHYNLNRSFVMPVIMVKRFQKPQAY